jgi:hypothetical protein
MFCWKQHILCKFYIISYLSCLYIILRLFEQIKHAINYCLNVLMYCFYIIEAWIMFNYWIDQWYSTLNN